jgi:MbtH protein
VTNPFDDPDAAYLVLRNDERQYSLWPAMIDVPAVWAVDHGPSGRQECLDFVSARWTDMRPASLIEAMDSDDPAATTAFRRPDGDVL